MTLRLRERDGLEVRERATSPERERAGEVLMRFFGVPLGELGLPGCDERLEPAQVDALASDPECVARRACDQQLLVPAGRVGIEQLAELGDMHLKRRPPRVRRAPGPQLVDQAVPRDDLVRMQEQEGEQRALLRPAQGE